MSFYTPNMASMIGLGVAVDYSLFVVVRYREELARRRHARGGARAPRCASSGVAVGASAAWRVVIALAGLLLVPTAAIRSMAAGAIIVVLVAMLACATLLPALLAVAGKRIKPGKPGRRWFWRLGERGHRAARRLARRGAHGAADAAGAAADRAEAPAMGCCAAVPEGHRGARRASRPHSAPTAARAQGAPVKILTPSGDARPRRSRRCAPTPRSCRTGVRTRTEDKRYILIIVHPARQPDTPAAKALIKRLRQRLPRGQRSSAATALPRSDFNHAITGSLWKIAAWVLIATFVLLLVMLRSFALALQAVVANVLSAGQLRPPASGSARQARHGVGR